VQKRSQPAKETEMTAIIILNVVLAAAVIVGIVGMLARNIDSRDADAVTGLAPSARRRRQRTSRARVIGRTVDSRA
jgi:hypothetical protein